MKRAFIIHGWDGYPEEGWFSWLESELEQKGFVVSVPAMPKPDKPEIASWVNKLLSIIDAPDENVYLIGHSIGCQTIIRYLEQLPAEIRINRVAFVAGWFSLQNLAAEEVKIAQPWLETPIDFVKVRQHTNNFTVVLSDDDPVVPFKENKKLFQDNLHAKVFVEYQKKHLGADSGITQLPILLDILL